MKWLIMSKWRRRALLLVLFDIISVNFAYLMTLVIRFDFDISALTTDYADQLVLWCWTIPLCSIVTIVLFLIFKLYRSLWRYASVNELMHIVGASLFLVGLQVPCTLLMAYILKANGVDLSISRMPISYYVFGVLLQMVFTIVSRFIYRGTRVARMYLHRLSIRRTDCKRMLIVGAGEAGRMLVREINISAGRDEGDIIICGLVDDDPNKRGRILESAEVLGNISEIPLIAKKQEVDVIVFAIPAATGKEKKRILNICKQTDCEIKVLPGVSELLLNRTYLSQLQSVTVEDLLGREPVNIDAGEISAEIEGKVVMVTGGGGSIGSELCRQIAGFNPKLLVIFDIYENNAYDLQMELGRHFPDVAVQVVIGSIRDKERISQVMELYRPFAVYHAAAHKHVPLMESSPCESIKNNVLGTLNTAKAAVQAGVKRFVMISTDKAVNPTNIMGASKRLCEMMIQSLARDKDNAGTVFTAVRFGNVLGSNGSVIPLFKRQIEEGGPVTVTHKDMIRYFMTIPEAVSLVLQAGAYAGSGEIYVLDMGEPVKISELAENLIRLSGHVPNGDIKIVYTGLRPGEKMFEEILLDEEGMRKTANDKIYIGNPSEPPADFMDKLAVIIKHSIENLSDVKQLTAELVDTYKPQ